MKTYIVSYVLQIAVTAKNKDDAYEAAAMELCCREIKPRDLDCVGAKLDRSKKAKNKCHECGSDLESDGIYCENRKCINNPSCK